MYFWKLFWSIVSCVHRQYFHFTDEYNDKEDIITHFPAANLRISDLLGSDLAATMAAEQIRLEQALGWYGEWQGGYTGDELHQVLIRIRREKTD
jgi:hypothetical protein